MAARGVLRAVLAGYLGRSPTGVRLTTGPHGKPALAGTSTPESLRFNLAHSGNLALYAVALHVEVGIDVERVRTGMDVLGIAARCFSPPEAAGLRRLPPELRAPAFFALWTRKEAAVKATGEGLSGALGMPAASSDEPPTASLTLFDLDPGPGYAAALAVAAQRCRLRLWTW